MLKPRPDAAPSLIIKDPGWIQAAVEIFRVHACLWAAALDPADPTGPSGSLQQPDAWPESAGRRS